MLSKSDIGRLAESLIDSIEWELADNASDPLKVQRIKSMVDGYFATLDASDQSDGRQDCMDLAHAQFEEDMLSGYGENE